MSGEKTKATLSWELNTIKVAAKELLDKLDAVNFADYETVAECMAIRGEAKKLRALVDGAAKEGAA